MLALWPSSSRTGGGDRVELRQHATPTPTAAPTASPRSTHNFNQVHSLSARYFGGGGDQVAQTNSPYLAYFQAVPSRMHNVSLVGTSVFTSHLVNQLVVGYNYFKQTFNSNDTSPTRSRWASTPG